MNEKRIINIERWDYELSLNGDRVKILREAPLFEEITKEIKREMEILCFHSDECSDDNTFQRAVYCIQVENKLFDWFFNSVNGYRAAYYMSPYNGLRTNDSFIQSLLLKLIASDKTTEDADKNFIKESLKSPSAKVWLAEVGKNLCEHCSGEWNSRQDNNEPEILNNRWENKTGQNAEWGRKAPYLTKIRIFGAFLNKHYQPYDPKPQRPNEIHDKGWT